MKTFLVSSSIAFVLLVSTAQAQLYRVPGQAYLEQRPYQPLQPYTVPSPAQRPYPDPQQYLPRQQVCSSRLDRTSTGLLLRTTCY